ncbi:peptidase domain-containing ABC transporter [Mesorhizobium sp. M1E.F.Ca.ET.045.02.1.1]|nr:peptidase domain-containing ABC transporter [Mesorhizobium sp. M1E.F.Ca.ET.045.02.1.1]AZO19986.1 peptidase domain-containing ABC transporter [Mesorhizobium sp. M1E.F.Ca.ET.045.02.1.1]RUW85501.1 ATP-binding cassette domain-containing protein [Mesorhizobium sp. M1E.F.Ca.ET.063.01.1.1]
MTDTFRPRWRGFAKYRTPVIRQATLAECGLACIAMIANYWGWRIDLGSLRSLAPPSMKGARLKTVLKLASQYGLEGRAVRVPRLSDLRKLQLPAMLHIDDDHFVVLVKVQRKGAVVHDPAIGRTVIGWEELSKRSRGIAAEFRPSGTFVARDQRRKLSLSSIWSHLYGVTPTVTQIILLSILLQVAAVVAPLYLQLAVDEAVTRLDTDLMNVLFAGFTCLAIINCAAFFQRRIITLQIGQSLSLGLMSNLFRHMLKLPSAFFEQRHLGDVTSRFNSTNTVQAFLTGPALDALVDTVAATIALAVLFLYGSNFALIVVGIVSLEGILHFGTIRIRRLLTEDKLATEAREETLFLETIRAIRSIKLFGREDERFERWQTRLTDMTDANFRHSAADAAIRSVADLIDSVGAAFIVFVTARAAMGGSFTIGMMMSFIAYQVYFGRTAKNAVDALVVWRTLSVHLDRIADLALASPEDGESGLRPSISGSINVNTVSFRYHPDEPPIVSDLSLSISAGEMVAITGRSGEGKTTLLKLMLGLERPLSGEVSYDGIGLNRIARNHFISNIATVMQDDTLLSGTIAENVAFFDTELDFERIEACARLACIHDEIDSMPMRYASLIGDMGSALSGGQKQRLMIARALYRQPKILFIDEGTSHLDLQVERAINDNLTQLNITRVVIAHRPDTLRIADRVFNMSSGGLAELMVMHTDTERDGNIGRMQELRSKSQFS